MEAKKKRKAKLPYITGEEVAGCPPGQIERAKHYGKRIKNMKYLLSIQNFAHKDVDDPRNFPDAKRVFTVIRIGSGSQET